MDKEDESHSIRQATIKPKLIDQVRTVLRRNHYSLRTEQSYIDWTRRFILFEKLKESRCRTCRTRFRRPRKATN